MRLIRVFYEREATYSGVLILGLNKLKNIRGLKKEKTNNKLKIIQVCWALFHLVGVICTGRWAGERKERISEVTL